jgi:hypothetical protein
MTAKGAARLLYNALRADRTAQAYGVLDPSSGLKLAESNGYGKAPTLTWESGPYEWAINLSGGDSIVASELDDYGMPPEPRLKTALAKAREGGFYFECENSFTLSAYAA